MSYDYDEDEAQEMAEKYGRNASEEDIENVQENMDKMNRGPLAKIWNKVTTIKASIKKCGSKVTAATVNAPVTQILISKNSSRGFSL